MVVTTAPLWCGVLPIHQHSVPKYSKLIPGPFLNDGTKHYNICILSLLHVNYCRIHVPVVKKYRENRRALLTASVHVSFCMHQKYRENRRALLTASVHIFFCMHHKYREDRRALLCTRSIGKAGESY